MTQYGDGTRVVHAGLPEPVVGAPLLPGPVFAAPVGKVVADKKLKITAKDQVVVDESLADLKEAWQKPLRW